MYYYIACVKLVLALVYCNFLKEVRSGGLGLRARRHQHKASLLECMRHHSNLWIGGDHSSGVYTGLVQLDSIHKLLSKPGLICCRGVVTTKCGPHLSLCFGWWPQLVVSTYSYVYALHWYLPMHCEALISNAAMFFHELTMVTGDHTLWLPPMFFLHVIECSEQ